MLALTKTQTNCASNIVKHEIYPPVYNKFMKQTDRQMKIDPNGTIADQIRQQTSS